MSNRQCSFVRSIAAKGREIRAMLHARIVLRRKQHKRANAFDRLSSALVLLAILQLAGATAAGAVTITSFSPTAAIVNTSVTINGTGFSPTPSNNTVKFNGLAATVTSSTSIKIVAKVPVGATSGQVSVEVAGSSATSATIFTVKPSISSFSPTSGVVGDLVTFVGGGFSTEPSDNVLTFRVAATAEIASSTTTQLTAVVPEGAKSGTIKVTVGANSFTSSGSFTVRPSIVDFSPKMGCEGTHVAIYGHGFSATPASNIVKFNGVVAEVELASVDSLEVIIPPGATLGSGLIAITVGGVAGSSTEEFVVSSPPLIEDFYPKSGAAGQMVTIIGSGFNPDPVQNFTTFGAIWAEVIAATSTELKVIVPQGVTDGPITIYVGGGSATSAEEFRPGLAITGLSSTDAEVGHGLTVYGQNFSSSPSANVVTFGNPWYRYVRAEVTSASLNQLGIRVPAGAMGPVKVRVDSDEAVSALALTPSRGALSLPELALAPTNGSIGDILVIRGNGFDPVEANNQVFIGGVEAVVLMADSTRLVSVVPEGAVTGPVSVTLAGATVSTSRAFHVRDDAASIYPEPELMLGEPNGEFGYAVASDENTVVIGAPSAADAVTNIRSGTAIVFRRIASASWELQTRLAIPGATEEDQIGRSVAMGEDIVAIGAPGDENGSGAVYVFVRSGVSWTLQSKVVATSRQAGSLFGRSVAISGDKLAVGAPNASHGSANAGAAYVFARNGMMWEEQDILSTADAEPGDKFGASVSLANDMIAVGAPFANGGSGASYLFEDGGGAWNQIVALAPSNPAPGMSFGFSVSMGSDRLLVGAPGISDSAGSAYLFERTGTGSTWVESRIFASTNMGFGAATAMAGDRLAVGGDCSLVTYKRNGPGVWVQDYSSGPGPAGTQCGQSVTLSGELLVSGRPLAVSNDEGAIGSASFYDFALSDHQPQVVVPPASTVGSTYGNSVAVSGDTALVGDWSDDSGIGFRRGSVRVFVRTNGRWIQQAKLLPSNARYRDYFGKSVALDGDTAVIGAPGYSGPGGAYVFVRQNNQWIEESMLGPNDEFDNYITAGESVAIMGDTAIVGAPNGYAVFGSTSSGAAYIYRRMFNAWYFEAKLIADDAVPRANFGTSVALGKDLAVVGAPGANASINHGAYVFRRSSGLWTQEAKLRPSIPVFSDLLGYSVGISSDRISVGSPRTRDTSVSLEEGRVRIFDRNGAAWIEAPSIAGAGRLGTSISVESDILVAAGPSLSSYAAAVHPFLCGATPLHALPVLEGALGVEYVPEWNKALALSGHTVIFSGSQLGDVLAYQIDREPTSTTILGADPAVVANGASYVVSVSTSAGEGNCVVHGEVSVSDGAGGVCFIRIPQETSCSLTATHPGTRALTAAFVPTNSSIYDASEGTAEVTVVTPDEGATIAIVGAAPEPSFVGHSYRVEAAVLPVPPATLPPSGEITISDGVQSCRVTLPATSCDLLGTEEGPVFLLASYSGDTSYLPAVSPAYPHVVDSIPSLVVTGFSPASGAVGTSVSISGRGFDTAVANNSVTFNGTPAIVAAATSTEIVAVVPSGAQSGRIGVAVAAAAARSNAPFRVLSDPQRTAGVLIMGVSPAPSLVNQPFNVSVVVTPPDGMPAPTGTVAVSDGSQQCTITLPDSACTLVESEPGEYLLVATYTGDSSYDRAESDARVHIVNPIDVTETCGFDPMAVPTDPPGFVPLDQLSGRVFSSGIAESIIGDGQLSVVIESPGIGSQTTDDSVDVVGSYSGPANTGISVNGVVAITNSGTFLASHVPLSIGNNALSVVATTLPGASATAIQAVERTELPSPVSIRLVSPSGFAPLTAEYEYETGNLPLGVEVQMASVDFEDDGEFDYASPSVADLPRFIEYSAPGLYTLTLKIVDTENSVHIAKRRTLVQTRSTVRGMLCDIYGYMKDRLMAEDAVGASLAFHPTRRAIYHNYFQSMSSDMPGSVPLLGTIIDGQIGLGYAVLTIARDNDDQSRSGFPLHLAQGSDGVWRISEI